MIKAIFFDLDGTLLPLDEKEFTKIYFNLLKEKAKSLGYDEGKFIKCIIQTISLMYSNDGKKTNEEVFWDHFLNTFGQDKIIDKLEFDNFYKNEFLKTKICCKDNPLAKKIVTYCRKNFLYVVLSTNPIFPKIATETRMSFISLKDEDFDLVTTYENSYFTKPNPNYFIEILKRFKLNPDEVILFGNNELEDYECAKKCGIKTFLVGDYIIKDDRVKESIPHYKLEEIIKILESLKKE